MLKRTKLSIICTVCYAIFVVGGAALALYMTALIAENNANGGEAGFGAIGYAILLILGIGYAAAGILPLIFHAIDIFKNRKFLSGMCVPFDLVFTGVGGYSVFTAIGDLSGGGDAIKSLVFASVLLIISLVAFIANLISLGCDSYD